MIHSRGQDGPVSNTILQANSHPSQDSCDCLQDPLQVLLVDVPSYNGFIPSVPSCQVSMIQMQLDMALAVLDNNVWKAN